MTTLLKHDDATIYVEQLPADKNRIRVELTNDALFMPTGTCETSYPVRMIDEILTVKGPAYLCDEILREERIGAIQAFLDQLPEDLRALCDGLIQNDDRKVLAEQMGISRSTIYRRIKILQDIFRAAGLEIFCKNAAHIRPTRRSNRVRQELQSRARERF